MNMIVKNFIVAMVVVSSSQLYPMQKMCELLCGCCCANEKNIQNSKTILLTEKRLTKNITIENNDSCESNYVSFVTEHKKDDDINAQDMFGQTKLHKAIMAVNLTDIDHLIDKGASFVIYNKKGQNPLQMAIEVAAENNRKSLIKFLTKKAFETKKEDEMVPIMLYQTLSFLSGNRDMLDVLLQEGISLEIRDKIGRTPLMNVIIYENEYNANALHWLIDRGAKLDAKDQYDRTAVIHAAREGHWSALKLLVDHRASIAVLDSENITALGYAYKTKNRKIIEYLIQANVEQFKHYTDCAIHYL